MTIKSFVRAFFASTIFALMSAIGLMAPASATFICNLDSGICTDDSSVQTPLGLVHISVDATNVVTVHLTLDKPATRVFGRPSSIPPGPPVRPGYARISVFTTGGAVDIDTIVRPTGQPDQSNRASQVIISIHPPSPCRVSTFGTTVVFTPR